MSRQSTANRKGEEQSQTNVQIEEARRRNLFVEHWMPEKFLEEIIIGKEWEEFLVSTLYRCIWDGKLKGRRGIDIGCGPTLHRAAILGLACDELLLCDYDMKNIEFFKNWIQDNQMPEAYKPMFEWLAEKEGIEDAAAGAELIAERTKSKLRHLVQCDVTCPESMMNLGTYGGSFQFAHSKCCLEFACFTYDSFVSALRNIAGLLDPGAALVMCTLINGDYCFVHNVKYEFLYLEKETIKRALKDAGFEVHSMEILEYPATKPAMNCTELAFSLSYKM